MASSQQDLRGLISRVSTAMITLTVTAVTLRLIARKLSTAAYGYDDWLALASLPFTVAISATFYFGELLACICYSTKFTAVAHGYGTPTGDNQYHLRITYVNELLWYTSFLLTKLSVLFFYNRVFGTKPLLRATLYTIGAITIIWWIVLVFISVFQCKPVTGTIAAPGSKCFPALPFFYAQTIPNLITDFAILLVPIPVLLKLQMRFVKKMGLILIFLVGYFVPIISIVRIIYYVKLSKQAGKHSPYDTALSNIWSILESAFALVGACIPTLATLVRRSYEFASHSFTTLGSDSSENSGASLSDGLSRTVRSIFTTRRSQDTEGKIVGPDQSGDSLEQLASNTSSGAGLNNDAEAARIFKSQDHDGQPANPWSMNPHRINN